MYPDETFYFCFGSESWVEVLDTEGRELASSCGNTSRLFNMVCHFAVVI